MQKTNLYFWPLLAALWQLLFCSVGQSQAILTHSDYFNGSLAAKTVTEKTRLAKKACDLAIGDRQFKTAAFYCLQISDSFYQKHHYLSGIRQAQQGMAIARQYKVETDTLSFKFYSLLASMYSRLTMNDSASYWYTQTENLLQTKPLLFKRIPEYIEAHYYNKGFFFIRLGDQERASVYIRKSVDMAEALGDKRSVGLSYLQLANYHFVIHQYEEAANHYRRALRQFKSGSVDACWGYSLLGNCLRASGRNLDEALRWLQTGKENYAAIITKDPSQQDTNFEIESSYYLGKCEQVVGLDKAASRSFQSCIDTYQRLHSPKGELVSASLTGLAAIALKQRHYTKALTLAQQALVAATVQFSNTKPMYNPTSDDIKAGKALYEALQLKGAIWFQLYKNNADVEALKQSIQTFQIALQVAQRIRRSFTQLESGYFFNEKIHPCVAQAMEAVFELQTQPTFSQHATLVFDLLQAYQAMGMTDILNEKAIKREIVPADMLQQEQDIKQRISVAETDLLTEKMPTNRPKKVAKLAEIKRQLYFFEDNLAHKYPRYYALKYDNHTITTADLQSKLDDGTAYLSYFLSSDYLYIFFATSRQIKIFRRIITPAFSESVNDLRLALERNPGMFDYEGRPASNRLFDYLISPVKPYLTTVQRLIVERDDILNTIPFDVLESREQPDNYLCKQFALSYSYAAKLTFTKTVAETPLRPVGFAPYSDDSLRHEKNHSSRLILRKSAEEVRQLGGAVYVNAQATKKNFLEAIPSANLLHLATHATADDVHPEASHVGFYPNRADSLLRAIEIVNLPLDQVQLVVLSACEGNKGVLRKAEGVLSLARAFRLAGCPTILTTSWTAHNETTSELMNLFYKQLHRGLPVDIALQRARSEFFASPQFQRWSHPYYWANFSLIGNPNVTFPATNLPSSRLLIVFAIFVIGGAALGIRHLLTKPVA